jgi:hypothetical protein
MVPFSAQFRRCRSRDCASNDGTFKTEDTVEKYTILSEGYVGQGYVAHAKVREELDRRYRKIGISAVAAAVRYQGEGKTVTDARHDDQVRTDSAA